MHRGRLFAISTALVLLLAGLAPLAIGGDRFIGRVFVDGLAMGGWTRKKAEETLARRAAEYLTRTVTLTAGARTWRIKPAELAITLDYRAAVAEAMTSGRRGWLGGKSVV